MFKWVANLSAFAKTYNSEGQRKYGQQWIFAKSVSVSDGKYRLLSFQGIWGDEH